MEWQQSDLEGALPVGVDWASHIVTRPDGQQEVRYRPPNPIESYWVIGAWIASPGITIALGAGVPLSPIALLGTFAFFAFVYWRIRMDALSNSHDALWQVIFALRSELHHARTHTPADCLECHPIALKHLYGWPD